MFGCVSDARMLRSRPMRSAKVVAPQLACGSFSATRRSSRPSARSASQTLAMPPWPISRSSRYAPISDCAAMGCPSTRPSNMGSNTKVGGVRRKSSVPTRACACSRSRSTGESCACSGCSESSHACRDGGSSSSAVSSSSNTWPHCCRDTGGVGSVRLTANSGSGATGRSIQLRLACKKSRAFSQSRATVRTVRPSTPAISGSVMPAK